MPQGHRFLKRQLAYKDTQTYRKRKKINVEKQDLSPKEFRNDGNGIYLQGRTESPEGSCHQSGCKQFQNGKTESVKTFTFKDVSIYSANETKNCLLKYQEKTNTYTRTGKERSPLLFSSLFKKGKGKPNS